MPTFPKTLAAAKRAKGAEWSLADALVEELGPRCSDARLRECVKYLGGYGIELTADYLQKLHSASRAFPQGDRSPWLTPGTATQAGSPAVVAAAVEIKKEKAAEQGIAYEPPTQREIVSAKRTITHHARQAEGKPTLPSRNARAASAKAPTSELRRTADVLGLSNLAGQAEQLGTKFLRQVAGTEVSAAERKELLADVAEVLNTWTWVQDAIKNPLSEEIAEFLEQTS